MSSPRNVINQRLKMLARSVGRLRKPTTGRRVALCYHSIHPTLEFRSCTPATFDAHLSWLRASCDVVPLTELLNRDPPDSQRRKPQVAITFDDGYADNYTYAFPLLAKHAVPATFFVTVGLLDEDPTVLDRFQHLRRAGRPEIRPMTWRQVSEMRAAGMEFGAHTYSHPNLAHVNDARLDYEVREAKDRMEQRLSTPVHGLAYPFGKPRRHFDHRAVAVAQAAGYRYAAAVLFRGLTRADSPFAIPRFLVSQDELAALCEKVLGVWDVFGTWQERAPLWLARRVSPGDFLM